MFYIISKMKMTENSYSLRKQNRQKEYDNLDILRAFSDKQFQEGLEKHPKIKEAREKKQKLYKVIGWWITTKETIEKMKRLDEIENRQRKDLIKSDEFLYEAILYEMENHEYFYNLSFDIFKFLWIKKTNKNIKIYEKAYNKLLTMYDR